MNFKLGQRCKIATLPVEYGTKFYEATIVGYLPATKSYLIAWTKDERAHFFAYNKATMLMNLDKNSIVQSGFDSWNAYLWINESDFLIQKIENSIPKTFHKENGIFCCKCKNYFPYAEANQNDGTLICFSCRKYPFYGSIIQDD